MGTNIFNIKIRYNKGVPVTPGDSQGLPGTPSGLPGTPRGLPGTQSQWTPCHKIWGLLAESQYSPGPELGLDWESPGSPRIPVAQCKVLRAATTLMYESFSVGLD